MPTYVTLVNWTEHGVANVKATTKRARAFKTLAAKLGARVKGLYWTAGRYDLVTICEAPDDETMSTVNLAVSMGGNVRSETMRAYTAVEMQGILNKLP